MQIILIRHAESKANKQNIVQGQTDRGLSEDGEKQSHKLSEALANYNISAVYSSDLGRAIQTAMPTASKLKVDIQTDPDLREADFGIWEGMTYEEVKEKYPTEYNAWLKNYFVRPHWFESYDLHLHRTRSAIERIIGKHTSNDVISVFTHGGNIKTQLGYFGNLSGKELADIRTKNCSLTAIDFNSSLNYKDGKLVYFNKEVI